eukprot:UN3734
MGTCNTGPESTGGWHTLADASYPLMIHVDRGIRGRLLQRLKYSCPSSLTVTLDLVGPVATYLRAKCGCICAHLTCSFGFKATFTREESNTAMSCFATQTAVLTPI